MSPNNGDDLRNERERLEIEKQRLELDRQRFEFEQKRSAATAEAKPPPLTSPSPSPTHSPSKVPVAMWVIGVSMIVACFLPWISMRSSYDWGIAGRGSVFLGDASGTHFWQGQLCLLLLIGALVAKHLKQNMIAGFCAIGAPLLAVHFVLQMQGMLGYSQRLSAMGYSGSTSFKADPSFGSIALVVLSIPFAILSFRQPQVKRAILTTVAAPIPTRTIPEVPTIIVNMITVQVALVLFVTVLFSEGPDYLPGAVVLAAALHWIICRKQKWPLATFWSMVLLATAVINWTSVLISSANKPPYHGRNTGNWLLHVALEFNDAIVTASPYTSGVFGMLVIIFAWSAHLSWKPKLGPLQMSIPRWVYPVVAIIVVLAYPLTHAAMDAKVLDIPSPAEREHAEMIVRGLTTEHLFVFGSTYANSSPMDYETLKISMNTEDYPEPIIFNDYGEVVAYLSIRLENGKVLKSTMHFRTSDELWSEALYFRSESDEILLTPQHNGFYRVKQTYLSGTSTSFTDVMTACPSVTYLRRSNTVRSLEEKLRAHSTFLSPHQQKVDLSSLSEGLRDEVRTLLHEGKVFAEFPPAIQQRLTEENQGAAIPANATGPEPLAIAKDVLLAKDTVGFYEYRYEAITPVTWVELTDSSIILDHQIRFIALPADGASELRSLRTYRSVFDTAGVLLASTERKRHQESVTSYDPNNTTLADGIFVRAWCDQECYVKFRMLKEGNTVEKQLIYAVENRSIRLFLTVEGDGGAGDYTNPEMVGKRFLLTMGRTPVLRIGGVAGTFQTWEESLMDIAPL